MHDLQKATDVHSPVVLWPAKGLGALGSVTTMVAYCSIVYELLLAQSLSIVLGQSFLRYTLTIGFYLFSLGMGAVAVDYLPRSRRLQALVVTELLLCVLGLAIPWLIFGGDAYLSLGIQALGWDPMAGIGRAVLWAFMHSWIFVIGMLSGCEIPILMELAEEQSGERGASMILGLDYVGTFLGAVSFPFLTYHYLGLVAGAGFTAAVNAVAAWWLLRSLGYTAKSRTVLVCLGLLLICVVVMWQEANLRTLLMDLFMLPSLRNEAN